MFTIQYNKIQKKSWSPLAFGQMCLGRFSKSESGTWISNALFFIWSTYSNAQVTSSFFVMKMCWFSPQDLYFWHPFTLREDKGSSWNYIQPFAFLSCPETLLSTLRDKIHLIRFRHFQRGTLVGWNPPIFKLNHCFLFAFILLLLHIFIFT